MTKARKATKVTKVTFTDPVADIPPLGVAITGHKNAVPRKMQKLILERNIKQLYKEMAYVQTKIAEINLSLDKLQNNDLSLAKQEFDKK